jgi:hypothetical protein
MQTRGFLDGAARDPSLVATQFHDLGGWQIHEAFAAQVLAHIKPL